MKIENLQFDVSESIGSVSAEIVEPEKMIAFMTLAHGAGADMNHRFMKALSKALADRNIGTMRFNFPYMQNGKRRPDPPAIAEKTVSSAITKAHELYSNFPILAGGKSFGGRMTSQLISKQAPAFLKGIVFYGFPLHPTGQPSTQRAAHLADVKVPMLFLQGTKDTLAELTLIKEVTSKISNATLHLFEGADHSFKAGKKELTDELADETSLWFNAL